MSQNLLLLYLSLTSINSFFNILVMLKMKLLLFPFDFVPTSCRKIPWINIYAQVQHDKEQEMIGSVSQSENAPKITLSDFTEPEELLDKELDTRVIGMCVCATTKSCVLQTFCH